jgi:hypothetical protein
MPRATASSNRNGIPLISVAAMHSGCRFSASETALFIAARPMPSASEAIRIRSGFNPSMRYRNP